MIQSIGSGYPVTGSSYELHEAKVSMSVYGMHKFRSLRKHAYSNILKILPTKNVNFQIKNPDIFHISAQNIDCRYSLELPRRGGSNEYPQSMFLSRNKKNNVYPCKPQFYYIKVGFLFVLRFYGPVNPMGSCRARSVYLTTRLLGKLSPLSG